MFAAIRRHKIVTAIVAFIVAALAVFGVMAITGNGPDYHAPQNGYNYSNTPSYAPSHMNY